MAPWLTSGFQRTHHQPIRVHICCLITSTVKSGQANCICGNKRHISAPLKRLFFSFLIKRQLKYVIHKITSNLFYKQVSLPEIHKWTVSLVRRHEIIEAKYVFKGIFTSLRPAEVAVLGFLHLMVIVG